MFRKPKICSYFKVCKYPLYMVAVAGSSIFLYSERGQNIGAKLKEFDISVRVQKVQIEMVFKWCLDVWPSLKSN